MRGSYTPGYIPGLLRRSELCKDESQTASILYTVRSPPNEETTDVVTGKVNGESPNDV